MKQIVVLIFLVFPMLSEAQGWASNTRFRTGTWNTVNVKYEAFPKLHFITEGQIRSQELYNDLNYWELKTFFHYLFTEQLSGGLGINFWDGIFEVYGNYNMLVPIHGVNLYRQTFGVTDHGEQFIDFGVSALLNLNGDESKSYVLARFGFILNSGGTSPFINPNDQALAMLSISLKPGF